MYKDNTEDDQRYHAQSGCQTVYTIDKVYGIGDKDHQKYGERYSNVWRDKTYTEESVEIVYVESGNREKRGRNNLHNEFLSVSYAYQVVGYTYYI